MKPRNKPTKEYTNDEDTPPTDDFDWGDQPFNDDYSYEDNAGIEGDEGYLPDLDEVEDDDDEEKN